MSRYTTQDIQDTAAGKFKEVPYEGVPRVYHVMGYYAARNGLPRECDYTGVLADAWYDGYDRYNWFTDGGL